MRKLFLFVFMFKAFYLWIIYKIEKRYWREKQKRGILLASLNLKLWLDFDLIFLIILNKYVQITECLVVSTNNTRHNRKTSRLVISKW